MYSVDMRAVRECVSLRGSHFFSAGAMRFFSSFVGKRGYKPNADSEYVYFVTSEMFWAHGSRRMYTVRLANMAEGTVDTVGDFQQYLTRKAALSAIMALLK